MTLFGGIIPDEVSYPVNSFISIYNASVRNKSNMDISQFTGPVHSIDIVRSHISDKISIIIK